MEQQINYNMGYIEEKYIVRWLELEYAELMDSLLDDGENSEYEFKKPKIFYQMIYGKPTLLLQIQMEESFF